MTAASLRVAVAQVEMSTAVPVDAVVAAAGERTRARIEEAAALGARLVQFPEGSLAYPAKRLMSRSAPELDEADWGRADWPAIRRELETIGASCAEHGIWAVVGAPHFLSPMRRPHNSLYLFSDRGELVTRYDKRRLSTNETAYLYTPGHAAVLADVEGFRLGFALCLDALFPELFVEYAAAGADAVLLSSAGDPGFGLLARAHAHMNEITVSVAFAAGSAGDTHRSGVCTPIGWAGRTENALPGLAIGEIPRAGPLPRFAQRARGDLYDPWLARTHPRSLDRQRL